MKGPKARTGSESVVVEWAQNSARERIWSTSSGGRWDERYWETRWMVLGVGREEVSRKVGEREGGVLVGVLRIFVFGWGVCVCMLMGVMLGEDSDLSLTLLLRWECSVADVSYFVRVLERLWRGPLICVGTGRAKCVLSLAILSSGRERSGAVALKFCNETVVNLGMLILQSFASWRLRLALS